MDKNSKNLMFSFNFFIELPLILEDKSILDLWSQVGILNFTKISQKEAIRNKYLIS